MIPCNLCILTEVFGMSGLQASAHVSEASMLGRSVVLPPTTQEIAESKADQANELRDTKSMICNPYVRRTNFSVDPA